MHRHVVRAQKELSGPKRAIRPLPPVEHIAEDGQQDRFELRKPASQQRGEIEALCIVVEFTPVDRESRAFGEWSGPSLLVEQVPDIVGDSPLDAGSEAGVSGEPLALRPILSAKTRLAEIA